MSKDPITRERLAEIREHVRAVNAWVHEEERKGKFVVKWERDGVESVVGIGSEEQCMQSADELNRNYQTNEYRVEPYRVPYMYFLGPKPPTDSETCVQCGESAGCPGFGNHG